MKKCLLLLSFIIISVNLFGQFDPMYSQYMRNMILINPGYTGSDTYGSLSLVHRQQWIGFDGAPQTTTLSYHTPLKGIKMGLGGVISYDKVGPYNQFDFSVYAAYHIKLNENIKLGGGLNCTVNHTGFNMSQIVLDNPNDPSYSSMNKTLPNIGAGLLLYARKWYFGVSLPRVFEAAWSNNNNVELARKQRTYFINGGYVFSINTFWKFKPTATIRIYEHLPVNGEATANFIYKDAFSFGAMYRYDEAMGVNLYYQFSKSISAGYAFDIPLWGAFKYSAGSHELMLKIDFIKKDLEVVCPRHY